MAVTGLGVVRGVEAAPAVVPPLDPRVRLAADGLAEVNTSLVQMDEVTQQNSALVEENAATAKTLEQQSQAMDEQVSFFQLGDAGATDETSRAVAAAGGLDERGRGGPLCPPKP